MKKRYYILITAIVAVVFLIGMIFNIGVLKEFYTAVFASMISSNVLILAALVGFVFVGTKRYWLIVTGSAVVASIFIQMVMVGNGFVVDLIVARIIGFMGVVFIMNMVRDFMRK